MSKVQKIEITFGAPVEFPDGFEESLTKVISTVCDLYKQQHPDRVMWTAGFGCGLMFSMIDAELLGSPHKGDSRIPNGAEPEMDETIYSIDCAERERFDSEMV